MTHVEAPPVEPLFSEDVVAREAMDIFKNYDEAYFKSLGALMAANGLRTPERAAHRRSEAAWNNRPREQELQTSR